MFVRFALPSRPNGSGTTTEQHNRRQSRGSIAPCLDDDRIQQRTRNRLRAAHDHSQQGDVIVCEHRPRCSEDIQPDGVGKGDATRHRLRKKVLPGHDPLEAMGVKDGVYEQLRWMEETEQFEVEHGRRNRRSRCERNSREWRDGTGQVRQRSQLSKPRSTARTTPSSRKTRM